MSCRHLLFLLVAALSGCATGDGSGGHSPWLTAVDAVRSENDRLMDYYSRVVKLKPQDLGREYDNARKEYDQGQSDYRRVRLALLLSLPGTTFRDDAAALALLQGWVKDKRNENSSLRPLASIILSHLQELRRVDDALQSQSSRLRDEQRRADALQQKLEALLEMEMRMIEREQARQPRKR
jgi:hypothetical protein